MPILAILPTALKFLRGNWHWFAIGGLGLALLFANMNARHWHKKYDGLVLADKLAEAVRAKDKAEREAFWQAKLSTARSYYAEREASRQPIILHSRDTVTKYAQTPAGKLPCLDADRVRGIDGLDSDLASPSTGSSQAVPNPASPPAK